MEQAARHPAKGAVLLPELELRMGFVCPQSSGGRLEAACLQHGAGMQGQSRTWQHLGSIL